MNWSSGGKLENASFLSFGCACRNCNKLVKQSSPNQLTQALKGARTSSFLRSTKPVTSSMLTFKGSSEWLLTRDGQVGPLLELVLNVGSSVGRMSAEDATDFVKLKSLGYLDQWQEMAKTERRYDALRNRAVSEQFLLHCEQKLAIFSKERGCQDLDNLAETAGNCLEAQGLTHLARGKDGTAYTKSWTPAKEPSSAQGKPHCFICNKRGHKPSDCWSRSTGSKSATGWKGKNPESFPKNTKDRNEASCSPSRPD
ncbi:hypothetical protein HPB52_007952 [Rhipicephalus sanguineus]|uniref:CCHC-type domain-containing protein n=1 Tax=Rhipicephalus sanguineus TaxID=34632 RepID=A0A9D4Q5H7_RHISA|nr:hypothetical protein HPB52_007952 [Rhipicephalus sanguineus]